MKIKLTLFNTTMGFITVGVVAYACSKGSSDAPPSNPCANVTISITATITDADAGQSNGSVAASATGSTNFTFSLNSGAFQSGGTFSNLSKGSYTITAKDGNGCSKTSTFTVADKDACAGKSITVTPVITQNSDPCTANGIITVSASGSTGFTYSLNNGPFQQSNIFNNVALGDHNITAKDNTGCVKTVSTTVSPLAAGPLFADVKAVIRTNCAIPDCHSGSAPTGGINFTVDCNIVINKDHIKTRAVDNANTANQMPPPPNPALSISDRNKITSWINGGGLFSN